MYGQIEVLLDDVPILKCRQNFTSFQLYFWVNTLQNHLFLFRGVKGVDNAINPGGEMVLVISNIVEERVRA